LDNIIKLYWNTEPVDPLLDYYEIVWRPMSSQQVRGGTASGNVKTDLR
jgi:hypothetical protein